MKKNITILFIGLLFSIKIFAQVQKTKIPSWIHKTTYNTNPTISTDGIEQGVLILLYEKQINEATKEFFVRKVSKITENSGVQVGSSINVVFDPAYQKLEFHDIKIIRNGKNINKTKTSNFQAIRKELNSESYIYDGSLTAISNLSDIRVGDILDYSYSIKGYNPIHKNKFSTSFFLNSTQPIGKVNFEIFSKKNLSFKYYNTDLKFSKTKLANSYLYKISDTNVKAYEYDVNTPNWKIQLSNVFVTEYKSWKEVIDWGVNVFNVNGYLSKDLENKIKEIKGNHKSDGNRILATLNFVQDEIRYLGLESGIGAYKPFSSNKVFKQRFGDCKDKSLLMVTMLNKMGINAYPMLVNTYFKNTITELLPTPLIFDHCVVKVEDKEEGDLWYDPTISNQGGTYEKTPFPDYSYGLVLKKGNEEFDQLYSLTNNAAEITDNYILEEVGKGAVFESKSIYYDGEADFIRNYFLNNSNNSIKKEYETYYSKYFYNIKTIEPPKFKDDIVNNKFTVYEKYKIDSIWRPSLDKDKLTTSFYPHTIINILRMPNKSERNLPFSLGYQTMRTHKINVKVPQDWSIYKDSYSINSPSLFYDFDVRYNQAKRIISISHILKIQKDHVPINEFREFYNNMKKIDENSIYSLIVPKDFEAGSNSKNWLQYLGILILLLVISASIWVSSKLYRYDPKPKIESYYEENKKIGGWLILVGIGLCAYPLILLFGFFGEQSILINGFWITFFDSDYSHFNITLGFIIFLEMVVNIFLFISLFLFIYLFFKKRSSFPKLYSYTLIGAMLFIIIDTFLVSYFSDIKIQEAETNEIIISFVKTGIISAYLLLSDSVKETFVKTLK